MHEPYRSPAHEPGAEDSAYPASQHETRAFDAYPHGGHPNHALETQSFTPAPQLQPQHPQHPQPQPPQPQQPQQPQQAPYPQNQQAPAYEPLAHEGGLPYGAPPAPVHNLPPQQQFVPQHLAMPQQFAPHPYGPQYPQPYMYPPQQMQTVFVNNNGGRRVNHVLHLVLTILTAGLWLPIWIILAIANS